MMFGVAGSLFDSAFCGAKYRGNGRDVRGPAERVAGIALTREDLRRRRRIGRHGGDVAGCGGAHLADARAVRLAGLIARREVRSAEARRRVAAHDARSDRWSARAHARGSDLTELQSARVVEHATTIGRR